MFTLPPPVLSLHSNGVTIVASADAVVGQSYTLNGTSYLVVDNSTIAANKTANIVTTRVTNMTDLFKSTSFNSDIGHWDTSTVTVTHGMFEGNTSFNQDISSWNTAALVDSSYMFSGATAFNQNYTSSWNTAAITNNSYMFTVPASPLSLHSNGVTIVALADAVVGQSYTLNGTSYLVVDNSTIAANKTANIVTTRVTNMQSLFNGETDFNGDISSWDTSAVTNMKMMFLQAREFNQDISAWDTSNNTNMDYMFSHAFKFNGNIGSWDTSNVTIMRKVFERAYVFNQDIGNWDTSNVTNMEWMFFQARAFNQDLSGWCVSNFSAEPANFASAAPIQNSYKPVWGTCP